MRLSLNAAVVVDMAVDDGCDQTCLEASVRCVRESLPLVTASGVSAPSTSWALVDSGSATVAQLVRAKLLHVGVQRQMGIREPLASLAECVVRAATAFHPDNVPWLFEAAGGVVCARLNWLMLQPLAVVAVCRCFGFAVGGVAWLRHFGGMDVSVGGATLADAITRQLQALTMALHTACGSLAQHGEASKHIALGALQALRAFLDGYHAAAVLSHGTVPATPL
jgi:hypothetical protein